MKTIRTYIHEIAFHSDEREDRFSALPDAIKMPVFLGLSTRIRQDLLTKLPDKDVLPLLEALDPLQLSRAVRGLSNRRREKLLSLVEVSVQRSVTDLLSFDPHTAASFMHTNYIQVESSKTIAEVAKEVQAFERETGRTPVAIVMNDGYVMGILPLSRLGIVDPDDKIEDHTEKIVMIPSTTPYSDVIKTFHLHPHARIIVTNPNGAVMGVLYSDDVLAYIHEVKESSLSQFAGLRRDENIFDNARQKVNFRWKWLVINLGTAFLASSVVGAFEETLARNVLLAVYLPIVAGMGGNAATQTLALMVRSIALGQITLENCGRALWNEVKAGFLNGFMNAILVFSVVTITTGKPMVGFVLGCALTFNLMIAGCFGTIIPLIMQRLGKDPASSATIFITTATDICGFFAFLGLATLLLM